MRGTTWSTFNKFWTDTQQAGKQVLYRLGSFFCVWISLVLLFKSEVHLHGQSPLSCPGFMTAPKLHPELCPLWPCLTSESIVGRAVLKNAFRGLWSCPPDSRTHSSTLSSQQHCNARCGHWGAELGWSFGTATKTWTGQWTLSTQMDFRFNQQDQRFGLLLVFRT